jgi:hypothetical protein
MPAGTKVGHKKPFLVAKKNIASKRTLEAMTTFKLTEGRETNEYLIPNLSPNLSLVPKDNRLVRRPGEGLTP